MTSRTIALLPSLVLLVAACQTRESPPETDGTGATGAGAGTGGGQGGSGGDGSGGTGNASGTGDGGDSGSGASGGSGGSSAAGGIGGGSGGVGANGGAGGTAGAGGSAGGSAGMGGAGGAGGSAGEWRWIQRAGGKDWERGYSLAALPDGSALVGGVFEKTTNLGAFTLTALGGYDAFVAKYDASGSIVSVTTGGGTRSEYVLGLAALEDGTAYLGGTFQATAAFGASMLTANGEGNDIYVAKCDANGNFAWAKGAGGPGEDQLHAVAVSADGSAWVVGVFTETAVFGSTTFTSAGANDMFIAKYAASGEMMWVKQIGSPSNDAAEGIAVAPDGSAFVTGYFTESVTFDSIRLTSVGLGDVFVAHYDADGNAIWATSAGGPEGSGARALTLGSDAVYVAGAFTGSLTFGSQVLTSSGETDMFVAKYGLTGSAVWATSVGGEGFKDVGGLALDASESELYIAGTLIRSGVLDDMWLMGFSAGGSSLWTRRGGGSGTDAGRAVSVSGDAR